MSILSRGPILQVLFDIPLKINRITLPFENFFYSLFSRVLPAKLEAAAPTKKKHDTEKRVNARSHWWGRRLIIKDKRELLLRLSILANIWR
jgi:hypothetical protein